MSFSSVGSRFHARGAATEKARSPNRRSVTPWSKEVAARHATTSVMAYRRPVCEQVGDVIWCVADCLVNE